MLDDMSCISTYMPESASRRYKSSFEPHFLFHSWPSLLLNVRTMCNTIVLSRILNSLPKEIAASVIYINTTRDLGLDLKERFA
uniref:Uncharacterized protein n=1 Tax=Quercus lobata TaxID=97700 RepID=A0A7N2MJK0_QUELO